MINVMNAFIHSLKMDVWISEFGDRKLTHSFQLENILCSPQENENRN